MSARSSSASPRRAVDSKYEWQSALLKSDLGDHLKVAGAAMTNRFIEKDGGICRDSMQRIGESYGVSDRTARRNIKSLGDAGWLLIERSGGRISSIFAWSTPIGLNADIAPNPDITMSGLSSHLNPEMEGVDVRVNPDTTVSRIDFSSTLVGGPALQAGPASAGSVGGQVVDHHPTAADTNHTSNDHEREGAPDAGPRGPAGAHGALDTNDSWPLDDESTGAETALSIFRGLNNGWMPTREQLTQFAAEQGLPLSDEDLREIDGQDAEDEAEILFRLRAGRLIDHRGRSIAVPPGNGTATTMLHTPRRRAFFVSEVCVLAERLHQAERLAFLQRQSDQVAASLRRESAGPETKQRLQELHLELVTELRRREASTSRHMEEMRA